MHEIRKKIRVMIADDHAVVRQSLASVVGSQPDMEIVGEAADGMRAVEMARNLSPDIILMDINMPIMNGIEATKIICSEQLGTCVIGLSMSHDEHHRTLMLDAGAGIFLSKDIHTEELLAAIRNFDVLKTNI